MDCTGGGRRRDRCPANFPGGNYNRLGAEAIAAGWDIWFSTKDGLGNPKLAPGEALCPGHRGTVTAESALAENQLAEVLVRLDAARALLAENHTAETIGDNETFLMCVHCGVAADDCDADGSCWGARVRAFLTPPVPGDALKTKGQP